MACARGSHACHLPTFEPQARLACKRCIKLGSPCKWRSEEEELQTGLVVSQQRIAARALTLVGLLSMMFDKLTQAYAGAPRAHRKSQDPN
jgi:hypothetical protein